MLTAVYKSLKKADTYLYIEKRDDFSKIPEPLMAMFGRPKYVMMFDLSKRNRLGMADIAQVKEKLSSDGFYLQLPPPEDNLLDQFKKQNGASSD
ncbi:YcgL domain-containing protein [Pseudoalteromonas sp. JBTF-M23]|uniref:YcgL domain-containing protein HG263_06540 n=1 Tax=Pseudoalteromonas caenipelagi TaxID=2726988 RepID=A0A849V9D2_9GAMM|nr:YcgL domain-containing protein [Pseudoalteromonas caenipelagi]NOU50199.1 YcgL domain-containing protein [Pseudoalteromonas caenipelagi]